MPLLLAALGVSSALHAAVPAAGTVIRNQATASFRACLNESCDSVADTQQVTSNIVQTLVRAVPGLELLNGQQRIGTPGSSVRFGHVLSNTGNDSDRYRLCVSGISAGFSGWRLYADDDGSGQPDPGRLLLDDADADGCTDAPTAMQAAGDSRQLLLVADIANGALIHDTLAITLQARSEADSTLTASNTHQVLLTDGPVIEVVKQLDARFSRSPGAPVTVTLSWHNTGTETATDLVLEDQLPPGMVYVPGSGRWSVTGDTPLTDDGNDAAHGTLPLTLDYCAYDSQSTEPLCHDRVRAVIGRAAPGTVATLTFQVTAAAGLADGTRLLNVARHHYANAEGTQQYGQPEPFDSNTVALRIVGRALAPAVVANTLTSDSLTGADDVSDNGNIADVAAVGQGAQFRFSGVIWNTGDGEDRFDLQVLTDEHRTGGALNDPFPPGTGFMLMRADGHTPWVDSNNNGLPDTGPIPLPDTTGACPARFVTNAQGSACGLVVTVLVSLPPDAVGGPYDATLMASSTVDTSVRNALTLRLVDITPGSVDLTNDRAADGSAPGEGIGPEAQPVTVLTAAPGGSATFVLVVNNRGALQDSYNLAYSTSDFVAGQLPSGWQVQLLADGGNRDCSSTGTPVSNTGLIPGGASKVICATVTAPANAAGAQISFYFRALSPTTGAQDIKHDAVLVQSAPAIAITPNQASQTMPGSAVVYTHHITNNGTEPLSQLLLSASPEAPQDNGWAVVLFEDTDGDGAWSSNDQQVLAGTPLSLDGSGVLPAGESVTVFARVFAPAQAAYGTTNVKTLTVTAQGAGDSVTDSVHDTTTVGNTQVQLTKEQALDRDCDGIPDGPGSCSDEGCYVFTTFPVRPGNECVIYRLTALNNGGEMIHAVTLYDSTQPYTTFLANAYDCQAPGGHCVLLTAPPDQGTGDIRANVGDLAAGETATLIFGLRVE